MLVEATTKCFVYENFYEKFAKEVSLNVLPET